MSEARAGPDRDAVDADPPESRGRPTSKWASKSTRARQLSTGVMGAACVQGEVRNTGDLGGIEPRANTGAEQPRSRRGPLYR